MNGKKNDFNPSYRKLTPELIIQLIPSWVTKEQVHELASEFEPFMDERLLEDIMKKPENWQIIEEDEIRINNTECLDIIYDCTPLDDSLRLEVYLLKDGTQIIMKEFRAE